MQPGRSRRTVRLSVSSWLWAAVIEISRLIHGNLDVELEEVRGHSRRSIS